MAANKPLTNLLIRHPYWLLLANLLGVMLIASGATRLQVDSGIDIFFADDDPNLLAEQQLKATYGREDNILFIIDSGEAGIFRADSLEAIETLTERAWHLPHSKRVDSITNFLHPEVDGDDIRIDPLVQDAATLDTQEIDRLRKIALAEQALAGRLLGPEGDVTAVNVDLLLPQDDLAAAIAESVTAARTLADALMQAHPDLQVHLAGWAVTEQTLAEVTAKDSTTLMPALLALVLVLLALLLRSVLAALCTIIVIALSIAVGMGYAGWSGVAINSVNVSAPSIILTLAVADCIHVLSAYLRALGQAHEKRAALALALDHTAYPVFLTSVTTAIGFLSMNFSESPPFRELGSIAAVGVIGALWVTLTILPGLLLLLPFRRGSKQGQGLPLGRLADFVIRNQQRVFWLSLLAIALSVSGLARIELNDDPSAYFSEEVPLKQALNVLEDRLSGLQSLHYSLDSGSADSITEPAFLAAVDRFAEWLREQPEVVNVQVFTDTLKRLNEVMHDDDPQWRRLPDSRAMAAQYTLLYEISVPYGQDVTHQMSADKSALKLTATLRNQKSQGIMAFEQRSKKWLAANAPELRTRGTGQAISFANVGLRNIKSMLSGSLFAVLLISGCLVLAFRSLRYGLVSLIPNLFPAFVALGLWGTLVGEVNIAASVVFSLTLGIIVDDTTHFLVKYIEARRGLGLSAENAVRYTFDAVGSALVSTSIVLALGFLALVQSDFSVNATSGLLVAATITIAIVLDLLFLPTLLIKSDRLLPAGQQT
tara:strand:- start:21069 stop:23372 length:2304 start_codon:yes stop_codon:yes gene_type:complete